MSTAAIAEINSLEALGARLTDPLDRQRYAELISYLRKLPPGDELFRIAQLFGFLTLVSEKAPQALQQLLSALEQQAQAVAAYQEKLEERLAQLPDEIAEGVDPEEIADAMSERFRQQLATTGLQDSARLLRAAVKALDTVSGQLAETVQPLANQYTSIGTTVSRELTKLTNASTELRQHNATLAAQAAEERWLLKVLFCVILFMVGLFAGLSLEKKSTNDLAADIDGKVDQVLQKVTPAPQPPQSATSAPHKTRK